jgi:enoyl-CoA hydratase
MNEIEIERRDGISLVRLNRPDKRNALTGRMHEELRSIFASFNDDHEARAVILTGAGDRAFCAGTDIAELEVLDPEHALALSQRGQATCNAIERCAVPVICAVNGIAAGGGLELALSCHIRLASSRALFSLPEVKLGAMPGYGGTQRLTRTIGTGRAAEMILTGRTIFAADAEIIGLVSHVVEEMDVVDAALDLAEKIAALAPLAIRACLRAVIDGSDLPLSEGLAFEAELFSQLFSTEDVREGTRAFLEKRPPVFRGR